MFKRTEGDYQQPEQPAINVPVPRNNAPVTHRENATIGPSISIKGDLTGGEDLVIEGRVDGKVDLKQNNVTIGKNGRVKADVYGKLVTVEGEVEGNLFGQDQIIIRGTGKVRGNISAPRVSIEDGATFKGNIDMEGKAGERPRVGYSTDSKSPVPSFSGADQAPKGGQVVKADANTSRIR